MRTAMAQACSYSTFNESHQRENHRRCCSRQTDKSVILILLWTVVVGAMNNLLYFAIPYATGTIYKDVSDSSTLTNYIVVAYVLFAVVMMCYPLGGFLADVYFGRYKTIIASLIGMAASLVVIFIAIVITLHLGNPANSPLKKAVFSVLGLISFTVLVVGLSGFTSNIVQFGLDQLLDIPCYKLGVFVHLLVWSYRVGETVIEVTYTLKQCASRKIQITVKNDLLYSIPALMLALLMALLLLNWCTHNIFNKERVKYNPYKMICRVLNFARQHKRPIGYTTAFAYCDDIRPSRIDFAKERYGGPFTTSEVEDVKTFLRVFLILLSLGPVFVICVPTSYYIFASFAVHTGSHKLIDIDNCTAKWVLLESGCLSSLVSVMVFPIYVWLMYSVLLKWYRLPKILHRIQVAAVVFVATILSMLVVDISGHALMRNEGHKNGTCMFMQSVVTGYLEKSYEPLNLHWTVLFLPNLIKTLAPDLMMATAFEFISAQSPHMMKGVLVGVLFAVRGFFQLTEAVLLFPFSLKQAWDKPAEEAPAISCGTGYFLVTTVLSVVGLILFAIASKKYKYRKRDEEPYSQSRIEEIFDRMLQDREQAQRRRQNNCVY